MDWVTIVSGMRAKLKDAGFTATSNRILESQLLLGTPTEIYLNVMTVVREIRDISPTEYKVIQVEAEELVRFGKSLNIYHFDN